VTSAERWHVGDVTVTKILEFESGGFPPTFMFDGADEERIKSIGWLHPSYAEPDGSLRYSVHSFVVESDGKRILVDACVGNDKDRGFPGWNHLELPYLERLEEAGYPPESIDIVLCTHLHMDHVGWNTRLVGDRWVPTFVNARYVFARTEWEHWSRADHGLGDMPETVDQMASLDQAIADSVTPIVDAGLHDLVESNHQVTPEVFFVPTPGNSPGHVSVEIRSSGQHAVITGDAILHPVQLDDPQVRSNFDTDRALAIKTRTDFMETYADQDSLVFGTHFATPSVGHIVKDGDGWRFTPAAASVRVEAP